MEDLYSTFENLPEDKKQRIIDICVEEFAQNGYTNASTNNIVKNAEISKGILFHYFGSKKNLYLYILKYNLEFILNYFNDNFDTFCTNPGGDIFERLMNAGLFKVKMAYEFPAAYKLLFNSISHAPEELKPEIQKISENYLNSFMPLFLNGMDTSKFRKDIDQNKAIELIFIAMEGIGNKYIEKFKNQSFEIMYAESESLLAEYKVYIDILKGGVYGG